MQLPHLDLVDQHSLRRRQRTIAEGVPYPDVQVHLIKPQTFVNLSGLSVAAVQRGAGGRNSSKKGSGGGVVGGGGSSSNSDSSQKELLPVHRAPFKFRANAHAMNRMDELVVVVDDFNVPFGQLRLKHKNSSSHNGLRSVNKALGTNK